MASRVTNAKTFYELAASGFFETQKGIVYQLLKSHGPLTQREVEKLHQANTKSDTLLRRRFSELEHDGFIKATGTRSCSITGREALVWQVDPDGILISVKRFSKDAEIKQLKDAVQKLVSCRTLEELRAIAAELPLDLEKLC